MAKFVRSSKYRHVFATAPRKETVWDGVKLTKSAWDANFVSVNPSWVAISWLVGGGGAVGIIDVNNVTKLDKVPLITGHKGPVLDLEFSPFHDNVIATASEDCYCKIWVLPNEPGWSTLEQESQLLKGHQRKVGNVAWNPVAENVLVTGGTDYVVKLWDVQTGDEKQNITGHGGIIHNLSWNYNGSLLTSYSKDKKVRLIDPRAPESIVASGDSHKGVKGARAIWLGKHDHVFTVGFGETSERQYSIWDVKKFDEPLVKNVNIDNSAGTLIPFYDEDSDLLFLAGRGDGNIRYYEIDLAPPEGGPPQVHFTSQYGSNDPTAAVGSMPKRGCDVSTNEIVRLFRVVGSKLEPLSFKVPRKSDMFQPDLFPDCRSDEPALTAAQWFAGESSVPKTKSLEGGFTKKEATSASFEKKEADTELGEAELRKENAELKKRVAYLEAELAKFQAK